jgi:hypothetical protein
VQSPLLLQLEPPQLLHWLVHQAQQVPTNR